MSSDIVNLEVKLIERFLEKREEIIAEAEKRAEEILNQARERRKKLLTEGRVDQMRATGTDLKAIKDKILGKAETEGRRKIMEMRGELISKVFDGAENRLRAIAEGRDKTVDYDEILLRLILEAASAIGEQELTIAVNERDKKILKKELKVLEKKMSKALGRDIKLIIGRKPIDSIGGAILYDNAKRKIFYNTLEAKLQKARSMMAAEVAKVLGVI